MWYTENTLALATENEIYNNGFEQLYGLLEEFDLDFVDMMSPYMTSRMVSDQIFGDLMGISEREVANSFLYSNGPGSFLLVFESEESSIRGLSIFCEDGIDLTPAWEVTSWENAMLRLKHGHYGEEM